MDGKHREFTKNNLKLVFTQGIHPQDGEHLKNFLNINGYTGDVSGCCDFCDKFCIRDIGVLELVVKTKRKGKMQRIVSLSMWQAKR